MYFLIYFSAVITTISVVGLIFFYLKHKNLLGVYNLTYELYQELLNEKKERE